MIGMQDYFLISSRLAGFIIEIVLVYSAVVHAVRARAFSDRKLFRSIFNYISNYYYISCSIRSILTLLWEKQLAMVVTVFIL